MSDLVDQAEAHNARLNAALMTRRRPVAPEPTGLCLNCGDSTPDRARWCSVECRDDWERYSILKARGM
ncbi:MAG: hypothetical protein LBI31_02490 [Zoogloeaceae bacterium]|jgi:hypothetical protein|nr:hypothetical protein [Zoogloeaceae bacterium]